MSTSPSPASPQPGMPASPPSEPYALADEQPLDKGWFVGKTKVIGPRGEWMADAIRHVNAPGLVVTSCSFGLFEVTHALTGFRVVGHFERMGNACARLASLSRCADWTQPHETIKAQLEEHGGEDAEPMSDACYVISGGVKRAMNKRELWESCTNWILQDEFPWESSDEDPFEIATRRLNGEREVVDDLDDDVEEPSRV